MRLCHLFGRALTELRLPGDLARAEGYGTDVTSLVQASKHNLRRSLERVGAAKAKGDAT